MMKDLILPEGQKYLHSRRLAYEKYTQIYALWARINVGKRGSEGNRKTGSS